MTVVSFVSLMEIVFEELTTAPLQPNQPAEASGVAVRVTTVRVGSVGENAVRVGRGGYEAHAIAPLWHSHGGRNLKRSAITAAAIDHGTFRAANEVIQGPRRKTCTNFLGLNAQAWGLDWRALRAGLRAVSDTLAVRERGCRLGECGQFS